MEKQLVKQNKMTTTTTTTKPENSRTSSLGNSKEIWYLLSKSRPHFLQWTLHFILKVTVLGVESFAYLGNKGRDPRKVTVLWENGLIECFFQLSTHGPFFWHWHKLKLPVSQGLCDGFGSWLEICFT